MALFIETKQTNTGTFYIVRSGSTSDINLNVIGGISPQNIDRWLLKFYSDNGIIDVAFYCEWLEQGENNTGLEFDFPNEFYPNLNENNIVEYHNCFPRVYLNETPFVLQEPITIISEPSFIWGFSDQINRVLGNGGLYKYNNGLKFKFDFDNPVNLIKTQARIGYERKIELITKS